MHNQFIVSILQEIAPSLGITIHLGSNDVNAGHIMLPSGLKSYFKGSRWDANKLGSSAITNDKTLTVHYLDEAGYTIPKGFLLQVDDTLSEELLSDLKFPLIVKPNSQSRAKGLSRVSNFYEIQKAVSFAGTFEENVRVEEEIKGTHLCFGVCNGKVYLVYEKEPFSAGEIARDFTEDILEEIKKYIAGAVDVFGLVFVSVDVICKDKDFSNKESFVIIEINSAPSFKTYGSSNDEARERVKSLYRDLIRNL